MLIIRKKLNIVSNNTQVNIGVAYFILKYIWYQIDQRIEEGDLLCLEIKLLFKNESWIVDLSVTE